MLTSGSIDYRLNEGLQLRQMPVQEFAICAAKENIGKASKSKLFEAFRGVKSLENQTAVRLWELWLEIDALCQRFQPFVLDLSDGARVHDWLVARRSGTIYSAIVADLPEGTIPPDAESQT
jgi:hypothetical protein